MMCSVDTSQPHSLVITVITQWAHEQAWRLCMGSAAWFPFTKAHLLCPLLSTWSAAAEINAESLMVPLPSTISQLPGSQFITLEHFHYGSERLLLSCERHQDSWQSEEKNSGPLTRLDHSELLCNKILLKYKRNREIFWQRHQKGAERMQPASL